MNTLDLVKNELKNYNGKEIKIMEVCGTHTSSIFKNGIRSLLSPKIQLISGPGCPVCVTSPAYIDQLVEHSLKEKHCVLTFGDMMKVKGTSLSLTEAKAMGGKVKILYSPLMAIEEAKSNSDIQYIFAAVGFETTAPIYALLLEEVIKQKINNLKLMTSIKTILPALSYICENEKGIDAFLCPGHVSVITGSNLFKKICEQYKKPFVIAGFEGEHIIAAVYEIITQISSNRFQVKNLYANAVSEEGNTKAADIIHQYFEASDDVWRGIGLIGNSGLKLRKEYREYEAYENLDFIEENAPKGCRCTDVILGRINPSECPLFYKNCTPLSAIGPCMVSAEGACGIWYRNYGKE